MKQIWSRTSVQWRLKFQGCPAPLTSQSRDRQAEKLVALLIRKINFAIFFTLLSFNWTSIPSTFQLCLIFSSRRILYKKWFKESHGNSLAFVEKRLHRILTWRPNKKNVFRLGPVHTSPERVENGAKTLQNAVAFTRKRDRNCVKTSS